MRAQAAVFDGERLVVDEVEVPPPAAGEVTVRVLASGICHSDLNVLDGTSPVPAPVVLGHEAAGVLEVLGEGVDGWQVGDLVVVHGVTACGTCRACTAGRPTACTAAFGSGATPFTWQGRPTRSYANISSFSQRITVGAGQLVAADGLDPTSACLVGCAVSTGYGVVRNVAGVRPGDRVAVLGVGGIGANVVQSARLLGGTVTAVDVDPGREEVARRFGAERFATPDAVEGLYDVVVECSGAPSAIDAALALTAPGGTAALVGIPPAGHRAGFDVGALLRGRRIVGSLGGEIVPERDLPAIVEHVRAGRLELDPLVGGVWPLARIGDAVAEVRAGGVVRAVLDLR